ncbi:hypothetical protein LUZ62_086285 [Rhynchospora pubera]|uniref:Uncharacterized protein n=1 Tax=Rhynchospora pubera TaxID=906938 RepID=A0AAV8C8A6_9POAL|nr:hypothetical protein LUZ62_086285 [Rhynchospora pubera]
MTLSSKKSVLIYDLGKQRQGKAQQPQFDRSSLQALSMRREGRQHGMVLCFPIYPQLSNPGSRSRRVNEFNTVPTTKYLTKVSSKPTNHSRFTSKCCGAPRCSGCHDRPVSKASTKVKKTHKQRRYDVALNPLLASHTTSSSRWVRLDGQSASGLLNQLTSRFSDYDEFNDERYEMSHGCSDDLSMFDEEEGARALRLLGLEIEEMVDADMGFCVVDFVRELAEDDDWCLVGEIASP